MWVASDVAATHKNHAGRRARTDLLEGLIGQTSALLVAFGPPLGSPNECALNTCDPLLLGTAVPETSHLLGSPATRPLRALLRHEGWTSPPSAGRSGRLSRFALPIAYQLLDNSSPDVL
jgi:hypothetical protein